MDLFASRQELEALNAQFFSLLDQRRLCVKAIQQCKEVKGAYAYFDPQREVELFENFHTELLALSLEELLAFSLLMESHSAFDDRYPRWSQRTHLAQTSGELFEMINPLLLSTVKKKLYKKLVLHVNFKTILNS